MNTLKSKWYNFFFFSGARFILAFIFLCLMISSYLGSLTPGLITNLSKNFDVLADFQGALLALFYNFLGVYLNRVFYQLSVNKYVRLLIQHARTQTYSRWLYSNQIDNDRFPQGEIISRIMSDTEAIRDLITSGSFGILIDLCFVISCLVGFIKIQKSSGLFIALAEALATVALIWGSRLMRDMFMRLRNAQADVNRVTANILGGFGQLYFTRHENYATKKSQNVFEFFLEKQNNANTMDAAYYAVAESLYPILLAFVIFIFPYSHLKEAAIIFAIIDLIQRSINPIKEISGKIANIQRALTGIDRIQHFLNESQTLEAQPNIKLNKQMSFLKLKVDIKSFSYPNRLSDTKNGEESATQNFSLQNICFEGGPGELIGIVGLSGSGKSTLLNILSGNLKADQAHIEITMGDKQNADQISINDLENYRQIVSIVSQDSHIFSGSLFFNITLQRDKPEDFDDQWNFFKEQIPYLQSWGINSDDLIDPSKLSLGQRQLLAGIRACYIKKSIVFFDEISSALDSDLELALRKLILLIQQYSLTIIVAHRVETVTNATKILVMDKGRVLDFGIHSELMQRSIVYQDFIRELSHSQ